MHMNMKRIVQGLELAVLMSAGVASAQTDTTTATPAVGDTGSGGNATANIILLGTSAIVAIGGTAYLARKHAR